VGYVLGTIFFILTVPIVFYLTSKYLLLLGDDDRDVAQGEENQPPSGAGSNAQIRGRIMKTSTLRATVVTVPIVFAFVSAILTPPDVVSQIFLMAQMLLVAGVLAFIVSRFKSFAQTPENIRRLLIVLVCLLSILIPFAIMKIPRHTDRSADSLIVSSVPPSASYSSFRMGNLWIGYVSNRTDASSGGNEYVICSVAIPKTFRSNGLTCTLSFSDEDYTPIGFGGGSETHETIWVDRPHTVTYLGRFLSEEDVSLLWNHRRDEELKISSPGELLALVKKLRAERAPSAAPAKEASY
jgi:hypothetical protein